MDSSSSVKSNNGIFEVQSECPICVQQFVPPVYQCNNGHVVCHNCLPKCQDCAICRQPMPKDKVRNLEFEKMLIWVANANIPCPRRGDGCTALVKLECLEKHLQECVFVPRRLCLRIGVAGTCTEEYSTGKKNQLIEHLISEHQLTGTNGEGSNQSSYTTLELMGRITMRYTDFNFMMTNFIRFDDNMFFVKKYWNLTEELVAVVVCMSEPLTTARKYSALVQLIPTGRRLSTSTVLEFKQKEIVLLTQADEVEDCNPYRKFKYHHIELCKVPFSSFGYYDRTLSRSRWRKLKYKARVTIFKNKESCQS